MKPRIATYKGFSRIIKQWVFGDLIHNALVNEGKVLDYAIRSVGEYGLVISEVDPDTIGLKLQEGLYEGDFIEFTAEDYRGTLYKLKGQVIIDSDGRCVETTDCLWPRVDWGCVVKYKVINKIAGNTDLGGVKC